MTQISPGLIMQRIVENNYIVEQWANIVEDNLIKFYNANFYVPSTFYMLFATEYMGQYQTQVERNFPIDLNGVKTLQKLSFKYGYPISVSICAFMIEMEDIKGNPAKALLIIMETPFYTYNKVFIEIKDEQGKKKLVFDDYLTKFSHFNATIVQFGKVHAVKANFVLS